MRGLEEEGEGILVEEFDLEEEGLRSREGKSERGTKTSCRRINERRQTEEEQSAMNSNQVADETTKLSRTCFHSSWSSSTRLEHSSLDPL